MRAASWSTILDALERVLPWGCILGLVTLAFVPVSSTVLSVLIFVSLLSSMWPVGERIASGLKTPIRPIAGMITLLAAQSIVQTTWYYAGGTLGPRSDGLSLALPLFLFFLWHTLRPQEQKEDEVITSPLPLSWQDLRWSIPLLLLGEIFLGVILLFAHSAQTTAAINSPWPLLPSGVLAAFFLLFVCIWISTKQTRYTGITALLVASFLFALSALAPLIYEIGFGFDGFLHRASESVLLNTGTLTPRPPYYIGQYVLVTWLSRLSGLSLGVIDRWLLPVLSALLPLFLLRQKNTKEDQRHLALLTLFIPFSIFSTTTPQAVAYLLGTIGLLVAWKQRSPVTAALLATWSLVTHPLAGLPLAAMTVGLLCHQGCIHFQKPRWLRFSGLGLCAIGASIGVPLAFIIHSKISAYQIEWRTERLFQAGIWRDLLDVFSTLPVSHLALWPDWADTVSWLFRILLLVGIIVAFWRTRSERSILLFLTAGSIGLFFAGLALAQTGEFSFLIDYERGNYAERLFLLGLLVLLPVVLTGWGHIWQRLSIVPPMMVTFWVIFLGAFVAGQVYNALPRHDAGIIGHGWSVSATDIEAVRFIEKDAQDQPYTVLANQSVSAAAVSQFGFKRYVNDIFFYPLPTGGPLYTLFLEATAEPSLIPIEAAGKLGQSSRVYLVLNKYWWNAEPVKEKLTGIADRAWSVRNGEITIFQFNVTSTSSTR
jgi:hypothetical protein